MYRPPFVIAAFTLLTACPWISDHNPDGDDDTDTLPDVDTTCDDVDWDGVCDADDRCVDGVDDTIDLIAVGPGETISGRVCGDDDILTMVTESGCTTHVTVTADPVVDIAVYEVFETLVAARTPADFRFVSRDFGPTEVVLSGDDAVYEVELAVECTPCSRESLTARWNTEVSARLCPWAPEVVVEVAGAQAGCDYSVTAVTSDITETTLTLREDANDTFISGSQGYLSIAGAVTSSTGLVQVIVSQSPDASVEQGLWLSLTESCE